MVIVVVHQYVVVACATKNLHLPPIISRAPDRRKRIDSTIIRHKVETVPGLDISLVWTLIYKLSWKIIIH